MKVTDKEQVENVKDIVINVFETNEDKFSMHLYNSKFLLNHNQKEIHEKHHSQSRNESSNHHNSKCRDEYENIDI